MSTSRSRGVFVRGLAAVLALLLVAPGPIEAIARAETAKRAARNALRHLGTDIDPEPTSQAPDAMQTTSSMAHGPTAAAILPVPLRPAAVSWLAPEGGAHDPWVLFDGRASTGLEVSTSDPVRIGVRLESVTALSAITLLGPAEGTVTVFGQDGDSLRPLTSLADVAVHARAGEWRRLATNDEGRFDRLVVQWTPSGSAGPTEIGLWGLGLPERTATDAELADRILSNAAPGAATFNANPVGARLSHVELGSGAPSGPGHATTFHASLTADPRSLARAFLVYELTGLGHFTEPPRQINGLAVRGGAAPGDAGEGGLQVEEIAPEWLRLGDNEVRFLPFLGAGAPDYGVRHVRIVGTPRAAVREARMFDAFDGKRSPPQRLSFEAPSQAHDVVFELLRPADGALLLQATDSKAKRPVRIDLHGLDAGWHRADVGALPVSTAVAIVVEGPANKGGGQREDRAFPAVSEVALTTSEVPRDADDQAIVVTYPLHGECVEHNARVRGFVRAPREAGGVSSLRAATIVADGSSLSQDASFEISVPEPGASVGKSWAVPLEATLGDGEVLRRSIAIEPCLDRVKPEDGKIVEDEGAPFAEVVHAGQAKTIAFAGAKLDIPEGAVDHDVRITVRPLVADQVPPMDARMTNVSAEGRAFRFGPHGLKFKKPVRITLPYDPATLRPGTHDRDILSFYYDTSQKKWSRIGRYGTAEGGALTSLTEHFTDFVNATLAMPDEPGPQSFNPNEMKGIKLADPSAGIDTIAPPMANSSGAVRLTYPIEIPPGRNGVQPNLAFSYDSQKTNGWLGVGWSLSLPTIEIDTRFGVPKYDGTEKTFLLDGEQIVNDPNAGDPNRFIRRVEGAFDTIERQQDAHGTTTSWTVTDKHGTVSTFGGPGAVLSDPIDATHIFRWGLSSVVDTLPGNTMSVTYFTDSPSFGPSVPGGNRADPFTALYPKEIDYTSHVSSGTQDLPAAYVSVVFALHTRTRGSIRIVNGRPSFQERSRFLLDHVDVNFQGKIIRRYQLGYLGDSVTHFHKSLIQSIALRGLNAASQLDEHTFEYNTAPASASGNDLAGFSQPIPWGQVQTAVNVPRKDDGLSGLSDQMAGGSGTLGIGLPFISATVSAGGNGGSESTHLALFDLNGDGLPDAVDDSGHSSLNFLRPSLSLPPPLSTVDGQLQFLPVNNLTSNGHSNKSGWSVNGGINFAGIAGLSGGYSQTSVDDDTILADVDGDGFTDLVQVQNGQLTWMRNDVTNNFVKPPMPPTNDSAAVEPNTLSSEADLDSKSEAQFYRVAPLERWVAPFGGQVTIQGSLMKQLSGGNGLDAAIYLATGTLNHGAASLTELWQRTIAPTDTTACVPSGASSCVASGNCGCDISGITVSVSAGDRIYTLIAPPNDPSGPTSQLGLESIDNQVNWGTTITYAQFSSNASLREPYGSSAYQFNQITDFREVAGPNTPWTASAQGTVTVQASIANKMTTSDDATILVFNQSAGAKTPPTTPIFSQRLPGGSSGPVSVSLPPIPVNIGDQIFFEIQSDTPIDPTRLGWAPIVSYTTYCRPDENSSNPICGPVSCTTNAQGVNVACAISGDPDGEVAIAPEAVSQTVQPFYPMVDVDETPTQAFIAPQAGALTLGGSVQGTASTDVTLLIQGVNQLFFKQSVTPGRLGEFSISIPANTVANVQQNDEIMATVFSTGGASVSGGSVTASGSSVPVNVWTVDPVLQAVSGQTPVDPMSGGFHRWFSGF